MNDQDKPNILLVDDRSDQLLALQTVLGGLDVRIVTARSGKEALKQLLLDEFALIIFDIQMPDMSGLETAAIMRQRARFQDTPVIFVTAYERDAGHIREAYALGALDYISTPESAEILRAKVGACLARYQRERDYLNKARELQARLEEAGTARDRVQRALDEANVSAAEWQDRHNQIESARRTDLAALDESKAALAQAQNRAEQTEVTLRETQGALEEARNNLRESQGRQAETTASLSDAKEELERSRGLVAEWQSRHEQAAANLHLTREQLEQARTGIEEGQIRQAETEKSVREVQAALDQSNAARAEVERLRVETEATLQQTEQILGDTRAHLSEWQTRQADTATELQTAREELERSRGSVLDWQGRYEESASKLALTEKQLDQARLTIADRDVRQSQTEKALQDLQAALEQAKAIGLEAQRSRDQTEAARCELDRALEEAKASLTEWQRREAETAGALEQSEQELARAKATVLEWQGREQRTAARLQQTEQQLADTQSTAARWEDRHRQTQVLLETASASLRDARSHAARVETRKGELEAELGELGVAHDNAKIELRARGEELSDLGRRSEELAARLKTAEADLAEANQLIARHEERIQLIETAAREQDEQFKEYHQKLKNACQLLGEDIGQQLRGLQSFAQLLKTAYTRQLEGDGADCIRRMNSAVERLEVLRTDLANLFEPDQRPVKIEPTDLEKTISEALRPFAGEIRKRRGTLIIESGLPKAQINGASLQLVLHDLVELSLAALEAGKAPELTFSAETDAQTIRLWFRDNSSPISSAALAPYLSEPESGPEPQPAGRLIPPLLSLRLGRLGGRLWAVRSDEQGNQFCLDLPISEPAVVQPAPPSETTTEPVAGP